MTTSKRSKTMSVRKTSVDQASTFLQNLPEKIKENVSLREAVDRLQEPIKAALAKGYSYDDLSMMLSDKGVEISASTLKNYVPSGKRQTAKEQTPAAKPRTRRIRNQDGILASRPTKPVADQTVPESKALPEADIAPAKSTRRQTRSTTAAKETAGTKKTSAVKTGARSTRAKSTISPQPPQGN